MFTFWEKRGFKLELDIFKPGKWRFSDEGVEILSGYVDVKKAKSFCYIDVLKYLQLKFIEDRDNYFEDYTGDSLTWIENGRDEDFLQILAEEGIAQ